MSSSKVSTRSRPLRKPAEPVVGVDGLALAGQGHRVGQPARGQQPLAAEPAPELLEPGHPARRRVLGEGGPVQRADRAPQHELGRDVVLDERAEHPHLDGAVVAAARQDERHRTGSPAQQVAELSHREGEGTLARCSSLLPPSGSPTTPRCHGIVLVAITILVIWIVQRTACASRWRDRGVLALFVYANRRRSRSAPARASASWPAGRHRPVCEPDAADASRASRARRTRSATAAGWVRWTPWPAPSTTTSSPVRGRVGQGPRGLLVVRVATRCRGPRSPAWSARPGS